MRVSIPQVHSTIIQKLVEHGRQNIWAIIENIDISSKNIIGSKSDILTKSLHLPGIKEN